MERVVRIDGRVKFASTEECDARDAVRLLNSRPGVCAPPRIEETSPSPVPEADSAKVGLRHGLNPSRRPHWGGCRLVPDACEFWPGRKRRVHDRPRYRLDGGAGLRELLAP